MHNQPSPSHQERAILTMLLAETQVLWSVDEIAREIDGDPDDGLRLLHCGGLIHRLDGFVWISRAAVLSDEIAP